MPSRRRRLMRSNFQTMTVRTAPANIAFWSRSNWVRRTGVPTSPGQQNWTSASDRIVANDSNAAAVCMLAARCLIAAIPALASDL